MRHKSSLFRFGLSLESSSVEFRRPARQDALDLATAAFLASERVDMQALAEQLQIARGTLYRWVSSREDLLDELLSVLARDMYAAVRADTPGQGLERVLQASRDAMRLFAGFEPVRAFVAREPQLAVGLMMSESGGVHRELAAGTSELLQAEGAVPGADFDDLVSVATHIATSLIWVSYAIGEEPHVERATTALRALYRPVLPVPAGS